MYFSTAYKSPVGTLFIACDKENIVGLWIKGQKYFGGNGILDNAVAIDASTNNDDLKKVESVRSDKPNWEKDDAPFIEAAKMLDSAKSWLSRYFAGEKPAVSELPVNPAGSGFKKDVWRVLCGIPYGEVITYGEIAKMIAAKMGRSSMSSQAVGGAVGRNPISIIIPCHRVIGANGGLTGYAGGIDIKKKLLLFEGANI